MPGIVERVYAHGTLTICCATRRDSGSGLPGTAQIQRRVVQTIVSVRGIQLLAARAVEGLIGQSQWDTRA